VTSTLDGTRVFGPGTPISLHPVITPHPETGKKRIYVNTDFTSHINDISR
jgi:taurine dioxygenase